MRTRPGYDPLRRPTTEGGGGREKRETPGRSRPGVCPCRLVRTQVARAVETVAVLRAALRSAVELCGGLGGRVRLRLGLVEGAVPATGGLSVGLGPNALLHRGGK